MIADLQTTIKAKIISIRSYAENWSVLSCEQGDGASIRATGTLLLDPETLSGVVCSLTGEWEQHPKYGRGFKFVSITPEGSEMYFFLTRIVKVGEKPAQAMVEMFSDSELTAIMETPGRHKELLKVKGVGEARLDKITESWGKYRHVKLLSDFLTPYGITPNLVMRVYTTFEDKAVDLIRHNPYQLTRVPGIGFKKADDVALRLGMQPHDPFRLAACIEYVMSSMAEDDGNTRVNPDVVLAETQKELDVEGIESIAVSEVAAELDQMISRGDVVDVEGSLALAKHHLVEKRILDALRKRLTMPPVPILSPLATAMFIESMQKKMGIIFSEEQAESIHLVAAGHRTICVTGHAGTGKSTLSKALLELLLHKFQPEEICCMALSGIASDRIRKTSGFKACTIHTGLGWKGTEFEHGPDHLLGYQVVLLDECSMNNAFLTLKVIESVDRDSVLILMGDTGQLPPIGPGDPFRNVIESGLVPVARLTKIYRQSEDSVLTLFANEIRKGLVPEGYLRKDGFKDFQFVEKNLPGSYFRLPDNKKAPLREANAQEILDYFRQKMQGVKPHIQDPVTDFQLLSPMRKGPLGTESLNQLAQEVFNPGTHEGKSIRLGSVYFKPGDKVVHVVNKDMHTVYARTMEEFNDVNAVSETRRVFNGSVGLIVDVDPDVKQVFVAYPEGYIAVYDSLLLSAGVLELAYALTTHKCQGSEYKWVMFPVSSSHTMMLTAQLLYTSITRAREKVLLVGQRYAFERACKSLSDTRRTTVLERLVA